MAQGKLFSELFFTILIQPGLESLAKQPCYCYLLKINKRADDIAYLNKGTDTNNILRQIEDY